jgi:hypothetical protein
MITNTGKQLIAKFLLGQAPAYATHLAIGCGANPQKTLSYSVTNKAATPYFSTTGTIGTISGTGPFTATISGMSSTDGIYVGQTISATTGTGNLGSGTVTVISIISTSSITISSTAALVAGTITNIADTSGYSLVTLTSTTDISIGDYITVSGIGYSLDGVFKVVSGSTTSAIKYLQNSLWTGNEAVPSGTGLVTKNYSTKTSLDFETFRTPIVSRGYVVENGISKLVLTAELPTEDRYEISEIGIFPSNTNPSAVSNYSRNIVTFASTETWQYWNGSTASVISAISTRLDDPSTGTIYDANGTVFQANADNITFTSDLRNARQERPRFLNNTYFIRADQSPTLTVSNVAAASGTATITTSTAHGLIAANLANSSVGNVVVLTNISANASLNGTYVITGVPSTTTFTVASALTISTTSSTGQAWAVSPTTMPAIQSSVNLDLSTFAATDEIRLALSIIDKAVSGTSTPTDVKFAIQFKDALGNTATAVNIPVAGKFSSTNRYAVLTSQIQSFYKTGNFDWSSITTISLYSNVGTSGSSYYVAYDAIRIENIATQNALYGMTGYTPIVNTFTTGGNTYGKTIVKDPNVSNLIEFRYAMGVS